MGIVMMVSNGLTGLFALVVAAGVLRREYGPRWIKLCCIEPSFAQGAQWCGDEIQAEMRKLLMKSMDFVLNREREGWI